MRTVLHIGSPKTGTTTLQRCFLASEKALDAVGVLYPKPPGREETHSVVMRGHFHTDHVPRIEAQRRPDPAERKAFDDSRH